MPASVPRRTRVHRYVHAVPVSLRNLHRSTCSSQTRRRATQRERSTARRAAAVSRKLTCFAETPSAASNIASGETNVASMPLWRTDRGFVGWNLSSLARILIDTKSVRTSGAAFGSKAARTSRRSRMIARCCCRYRCIFAATHLCLRHRREGEKTDGEPRN